jgi:formate dehydrogenase subunit gamma
MGMAGILVGLLILVLVSVLSPSAMSQQPGSNVRPPVGATVPGGPGVTQPERHGPYDIEMWRKVREGIRGQVSIPDKKAGQLVQSDGEAWRNFRNGPLPLYGSWAMAGTLALLALFFLVRGRIAIDHGWAGRTILRFNSLERFAHWLLAVSFIVLALTGLNILYGRYVLLPVLGKEAFAAMSQVGKLLHNYVAFAFMVGLLLTFVVWIRHNFPSWQDVTWLAKGGGMLVKGSHPPAWKFNAGQKILFWLVMLGGLSISLSGIALMFPFETAMFAKTFAVLNVFGLSLPTELTPIQEMQYASSWHAIVSLLLVCVIIAHIYIGTLGMQGAFSAMGSGEVDVNWAKEHHSLWADEELKRTEGTAQAGSPGVAPAE